MGRTVNWFINLIIRTTIWTLSFAFQILRTRVLPLVLVLLLRVTRFLIMLIIYSVVGTFTGPRRAARETASEWEERVLERGVPPAFAFNLFPLFRVGAYLLLLAGWLVIVGINLLVYMWIDLI